MMIWSLGMLSSPKSFPALIKRLEEIKPGDFDETYTLIKSTTNCLNPQDKNAAKKLINACLRIQRMLANPDSFPDPQHQVLDPNYDVGQQPKDPPAEIKPTSYVAGARIRILDELTKISLSVAGYKEANGWLATELNNISRKLGSKNNAAYPNASGSWVLLDSFQPQSAVFLVNVLPRLSIGKRFLEQFITSGWGGI